MTSLSSRTQTTLLGLAALAILLTVLAMVRRGLRPHGGQRAALEHGHREFIYARQFSQLFPQDVRFISYYTGHYGRPTWNSKSLLHDRYILHMQCHVGFNFGGTRITSHAEPTFVLNEVTEITLFTGGGASSSYASEHRFGLSEWETLVASGGDFEAIGIRLKQDQPVKDLAEYWQFEQRKHGQ